jgi:hypothetical protein
MRRAAFYDVFTGCRYTGLSLEGPSGALRSGVRSLTTARPATHAYQPRRSACSAMSHQLFAASRNSRLASGSIASLASRSHSGVKFFRLSHSLCPVRQKPFRAFTASGGSGSVVGLQGLAPNSKAHLMLACAARIKANMRRRLVGQKYNAREVHFPCHTGTRADQCSRALAIARSHWSFDTPARFVRAQPRVFSPGRCKRWAIGARLERGYTKLDSRRPKQRLTSHGKTMFRDAPMTVARGSPAKWPSQGRCFSASMGMTGGAFFEASGRTSRARGSPRIRHPKER